ncbi:MAG: hypothetical protein JKY52_17115 [Flavobacteriales bacterium]|nr:hypothetical protein [Flavobacteriales bacterium]
MVSREIKILLVLICTANLFSFNSYAQQKSDDNKSGKELLVFKREVILSGGWSTLQTEPAGRQSVGFELLQVFSGKQGDWGKLLLQFRLARYDNAYMLMNETKMPLMHLNSFNTWAAEFHDAYFEYGGKLKGKLALRLGHFDVPFGLEENEHTHSTLVQLMSMRNIGFKKDWGLSVLGRLAKLDYNFAITRGSGVYLVNRRHNFLISGRVGTPADENFIMGISAIYGRPIDQMATMRGMKMESMGGMNSGMGTMNPVMQPSWFGSDTKPAHDIIARWRTGIDLVSLIGPFVAKGEVSYGKDVNQDIFNALAGLSCNLKSTLMAVAQFQYAYQNISDVGSKKDVFALLGLNYKLSPYITFMTSFTGDIKRLKKNRNANTVSAQIYFYW